MSRKIRRSSQICSSIADRSSVYGPALFQALEKLVRSAESAGGVVMGVTGGNEQAIIVSSSDLTPKATIALFDSVTVVLKLSLLAETVYNFGSFLRLNYENLPIEFRYTR